MTRLIALIDGSNYTPSVLDHAAWAASALDLEVDVVHVIGRRDTGMPLDWSGNLELGARSHLLNELAEHDAERARLANERARLIVDAGAEHLKKAGVKGVRPMVRRGDIVEAMQDLEPDARLFVIGKRGEAADFAKMHLGSNLERVVRVSKKPVIVASRAFQPVKSFLIAYDGGPSADKAVDHIANGQLFPGLDCHLVMAGREARQHRPKLDQAADKLTGAGYTVTAAVEEGEPEGAIGDYVKTNNIGLLVMGAYGHSRIRSLIIGSTTTEMIRSVLVPVMLFR